MGAKKLNAGLTNAAKEKKDEFYTQLIDIEKELKHYKSHFSGKTVYCNCDDPYESNFFKYFAANFKALRIKKLITTSYYPSPIVGRQLPLSEIKGLTPEGKQPFKIEINEVRDFNSDGAIDLTDVEWLLKHNANVATPLAGNGDFRSTECLELLKASDIVVTNPPFSLFRDYTAQLITHNKKFLIIGNINAVTYKELFPLIIKNKIWLGASIHSGDREFRVPDTYELNAANYRIGDHGEKYLRIKGVRWFTNLDYKERHEKLVLYKKYSPKEYPKYDRYHAINVNRTADIPVDYQGAMGVPITFLDKYDPKQFEILDANDLRINTKVPKKPHGLIKDKDSSINQKPTYVRIAIKHRS